MCYADKSHLWIKKKRKRKQVNFSIQLNVNNFAYYLTYTTIQKFGVIKILSLYRDREREKNNIFIHKDLLCCSSDSKYIYKNVSRFPQKILSRTTVSMMIILIRD